MLHKYIYIFLFFFKISLNAVVSLNVYVIYSYIQLISNTANFDKCKIIKLVYTGFFIMPFLARCTLYFNNILFLFATLTSKWF